MLTRGPDDWQRGLDDYNFPWSVIRKLPSSARNSTPCPHFETLGVVRKVERAPISFRAGISEPLLGRPQWPGIPPSWPDLLAFDPSRDASHIRRGISQTSELFTKRAKARFSFCVLFTGA